MNNLKLRNYQIDIIEQTLQSNISTLIQVPTGGGKTVIAKEITLSLVTKYNKQVLFVAPKIVLMEQTAKTYKSLNPHIVHGIKEYDKHHPILISTLQTASRRDITPDVIIIDEIHHGYDGKMISTLISEKPNIRIIGLSATPFDKNGKLLQGFGLVLNQYDVQYMIRHGYLVDLKSYQLVRIRNLEKIKITAGDYNLEELGKIVSDNQTILEIVESSLNYIDQYKKAIVFAVDINHSELLSKAYQMKGYSARALHSKMNKDEIDREIRRFRDGQTKILVSVQMLTTGFDVPDTDVAIIARPTKSQNLYKQMVGRVLRIAEGKTHAVLLDCGNVIENLGMPLDPIRVVDGTNRSSRQICQACGSEKLQLKKDGNQTFWKCKECGHRKDIEHGAYQCKTCNTVYTHDAQFEQKNNKLYLVCNKCPYPTLISEFTGEEKFVEIKQNKVIYLPFIEAKQFVHTLNLKSKKDWNKLVLDVKNAKVHDFPSNIPLEPNIVYQNDGWINTLDWIGLTDSVIGSEIPQPKTNELKEQYWSYEEARSFIDKLDLLSLDDWAKYRKNTLEGFGPKPIEIPDKPQDVYKNKGWKNFDVWLGLDYKKEKKLAELEKAIRENSIENIHTALYSYRTLGINDAIQILIEKVPNYLLNLLIDDLHQSEQIKMMNLFLENNNFSLFKKLAEKTHITNVFDDKKYTYELGIHIDKKSVRHHLSSIDNNTDLSMIKYIVENYDDLRLHILKKAIELNLVKVIDLFLEYEYQLDDIYFDYYDGDLEFLQNVLNSNPVKWIGQSFNLSHFLCRIERPDTSENIHEYEKNQIDTVYYDMLILHITLQSYEVSFYYDEGGCAKAGLRSIILVDHVKFMELLLETGLDPNFKLFETPVLTTAILSGSVKTIEILLDNGAQKNINDFYLAIKNNLPIKIIQRLYDFSYDINQKLSNKTLLHYAIEHNNIDSTKFLLSINANPKIKNDKNQTALDLAMQLNNQLMIKMIEQNIIGIAQ